MIHHRWLVPVCLALVAASASAQYAARNDFIRDDGAAGFQGVDYAANDDTKAPINRVVVVTNARQGNAEPQCGDSPSTFMGYNQSTTPQCPFDTFVYRVEYAPGQWSNEAVVFALIPAPAAVTDCNGNCVEDFGDNGDCDGNHVPDECEVPLLRRGVTVHAGKNSFMGTTSQWRASISDDGGYVAFSSIDDLATIGSTCQLDHEQIYRLDMKTGELLLVSTAAGGLPADGDCARPSISGDGSAIAFESVAANLAGDANGSAPDVFVWTPGNGIELVSVDDAGLAPSCGDSRRPAITDDGRFVSFDSTSPLVSALGLSCTPPPAGPFTRQVYQHDRLTGATRILSAVFDAQGAFVAAADADAHSPVVNARGRYTAYVSAAQNLVPRATNGLEQVYVFNRELDRTLLVSVSDADAVADAPAVDPTIDGSGFVVSYSSAAGNLVADSTPAAVDQIYVAQVTGTWATTLDVTTSWVSRNGATPADLPATLPALSGDGRWVAFQTASALTPDDKPCNTPDVFVVDRTDGSVAKTSVGPRGAPASGRLPFIDFDGGKVGFAASGSLTLRTDFNTSVLVRDRNASAVLDGSAWLRVANAAELDLDSAGPPGMTIEGWVRLDDVASTQTIAAKWSDAGLDERSQLLQVLPGGALRWQLSASGADAAALTGGLLTAAAWHHVACTYDGASRRIHVDGELVAQAGWAGPVHDGAADLSLGAHLRDGGTTVEALLHGRLDELRLWRRALAVHEIRWLLDEGVRGDTRPFFPDLVALWSFEDGGADGVGSNDAQPQGAVTFPRGAQIPFLEFDCDANNYPDAVEILLDPSLDANFDGRLDACEIGGPVLFCNASDSALASCPCANPGDPASGCDNAQGTGGVRAALTVQDTLSATGTIVGEGYPAASSPTTIVIRSTAQEPVPQVLFDGVRCVALSGLVRLAAATAVNGVSTHGLSHGAGPGTFYYQIWYRNTPSTFCDPTVGANLSNGLAITW